MSDSSATLSCELGRRTSFASGLRSMKLRQVCAVSSLALLLGSGCGSDGGGGGGTPTSKGPIVNILVDTNRNGIIDLDDPTEDQGEDVWDATSGAILLANLDDDSLRCPKGNATAQMKDEELASCFDAADNVINGGEFIDVTQPAKGDFADLARLVVQAWPGAPDDAVAQLHVDPPANQYVRMFRQGQSEGIQGPIQFSAAEIRQGTLILLEATDIVRDAKVWDGKVKIVYKVLGGAKGNGEDIVEMRVAPLMLEHHLQPALEIYATKTGSQGSVDFRGDLDKAAKAAGVQKGLNALALVGSGDQWTQDWMEVGVMTMPAPGGQQHKMDVFMRSVNFTGKLRKAGRQVYDGLHGVDAAGLTPSYDPDHADQMDSLNSYGNTETVPPYEHNGKSYPMGRIFRGSVNEGANPFFPDPAMQTMLDSQGIQPAIFVDTSWLLVGHVDETVSFVKMNNARGWGLAVNDVALAYKMLNDLKNQGHGAVPMFEGKFWSNGQAATATIDEVLKNDNVKGESDRALVEVNAQLDILKAEIGLTDADLVPMPFLHMKASGFSLAYQPGTVNGIYLSDKDFAVPKPHGPKINGVDPFEEQLKTAFAKHGITVHFVEDWDLYHRLSGEVHCGSNTRRQVQAGAPWWESGQ